LPNESSFLDLFGRGWGWRFNLRAKTQLIG
jgi:hypothetical protein